MIKIFIISITEIICLVYDKSRELCDRYTTENLFEYYLLCLFYALLFKYEYEIFEQISKFPNFPDNPSYLYLNFSLQHHLDTILDMLSSRATHNEVQKNL